MKIKNAIVTGATGFIGSNLCAKLIKDGWRVSIITRPESNLSNLDEIINELNIFVYDGILLNLIKWFKENNAQVVFHLASYVVNEHSINDINRIIDSNIRFGLDILESMKLSKTRLLVNTGTFWQNFNNEKFNPVNLYASSKESFMCFSKYYTEAEGIRVITLKLFDTYGFNDKRPKLLNLLNEYAEKGEVIDLSPGNQLINIVHIDDVISAYLRAFDYMQENPSIREVEFAVSAPTLISLKNLVFKFMEYSGKAILINWGGRAYRRREVMNPLTDYVTLPGWKCNISLEEGLKMYKYK